jgi:DNA-binding transcriptional MerR regulator
VLLLRARRLVELGLSLEEVADALSDDRRRDLVEIIQEIDGTLALRQEQISRQRAAIADLLRADGDLRSPALAAVLRPSVIAPLGSGRVWSPSSSSR